MVFFLLSFSYIRHFYLLLYSQLRLKRRRKNMQYTWALLNRASFDYSKVYCLSNLNSLYKWMISVSISLTSETSQVNVISRYYKWQTGDSWIERGGGSWYRRSMIMSSLIYLIYNCWATPEIFVFSFFLSIKISM